MKVRFRLAWFLASILLGGMAVNVYAATEIHWWHAMGGALGERVADIAKGFNESQTQYKVIATYRGNYTENMTAGIAAFRSGKSSTLR